MKKSLLLVVALMASFCFGYALNGYFNQYNQEKNYKKVTGIGGIFFKCKDPKKSKNGTVKILVLIPMPMVPCLNGTREPTVPKKVLHNGVRSRKPQNIFNHLKKIS